MPAFLTTKAEFDACLRKNPAVVVDFTAAWCGPCRMIAPHFEGMEREFPTVVFKKVDVDDNREAAASAGVRSMPTFVMYRDGRQVDVMTGADPSRLRDMIRRHAPAARPAMPPREPHVSAGLFTKIDAAAAIQKVQQTDGILLAFACGDDEPSKTMKTTLDVARFAAISTQYNIVFLLLQSGSADLENFKQMYPVICLPSLYFIGPDGAVLHFLAGAKAEGEIRDALRTAIQAKKGKAGDPAAPLADGDGASSTAVNADASVSVEASPAQDSVAEPTEPGAGESGPADGAVAKSARERARELQEQLRAKRLEEEKEKERQDEIRRRTDGKLAQDCRQRVEEASRKSNLEQMAKKRRDEEEQDRLHREKVRRQLEEDRRARKLQSAAESGEGKDSAAAPSAASSTTPAAAPAPRPASDTTRIKVTLLSGEVVLETFQAADPLQVLLDFVAARQPGLPFVLLQTFPRRRYTAEDSAQTLAQLGLVPNVALLCSPVEGAGSATPAAAAGGSSGGGGLLSWFSSFLPGGSPAPAAQPAAA
eukprot:EG_transcript_9285